MMDYDNWLQAPYQVESDGTGEFEFNMRFRGGTIHVTGEIKSDVDQDEDGQTSYLYFEIETCTWSFCEDAEVDYDKDEEKIICAEALEQAEVY